MRLITAVMAAGMTLIMGSAAQAQNFFGASGNSFDPTIDVVESGVLLDAQAVVSADRKYVTLTMRPQNASLLALRDFTFQNGFNPNFVGNGAGGGVAPGANARPSNSKLPPALTAPPPPKPSILQRTGMTQLNASTK